MNTAENILARLVPEGECRVWTGATRSGYGEVSYQGRPHYVHRLAYEHRVGPIPEGLQIDHICRNRLCANHHHLEPVTRRENILRGNSPAARQARQTHCLRGHPFDEPNTHITPQGKRYCRHCGRIRSRLWKLTHA